jgi:hypothetical protein
VAALEGKVLVSVHDRISGTHRVAHSGRSVAESQLNVNVYRSGTR